MHTKILFKRPVENTPAQALDKASVIELIEFERFCRDNALWDEMKTCFAPESRITISWFQGSGQEFVEASSRMKTRAPHKLNNTVVWVHGDRAVSITMASIESRLEIDGHLLEMNSDVKLLYRSRRIDGQWHIVSMDGIYEKDGLVPVFPIHGLALPKEDIAELRPSYASLAYALGRQGYAIDPDLPGIDRPELVEALYVAADEWLGGTEETR